MFNFGIEKIIRLDISCSTIIVQFSKRSTLWKRDFINSVSRQAAQWHCVSRCHR